MFYQYETDCGLAVTKLEVFKDLLRKSMPEPIRDSPSVARPYCPRCEENVDHEGEILDVRWCSAHTPVSTGIDDNAVAMDSYPAGSGEAGGEDNRRWCALFHRQTRYGTRSVNAKIENRLTK